MQRASFSYSWQVVSLLWYMPQTHSDGKTIYSVDMLLAYVNLFKPKPEQLRVKSFESHLTHIGWGDPSVPGGLFSPRQVLLNPEDYPDDMKRITDANMSFPIMVTEDKNLIIDGVHRLTKAFLTKQETIWAYVIPRSVMQKCILATDGNWDKADNTETWELMVKFVQLLK